MRVLAPIIGVILLIGIIGSLLTVLVYALAGLAALGLSVMVIGWVGEKITWRQAGKRIHATAASVERKAATLEAERPEVMPEEMRHPAWQAAITARTEDRRRLAGRYLSMRERVNNVRYGSPGRLGFPASLTMDPEELLELDRGLDEVEELVRKTFGTTRPSTIVRGLDYEIHGVDLAPPRSEVLHLGRRFQLLTDCRYGHAGAHNIVGITGMAGAAKEITNVPAGRLLRECDVCQPATRWTENP